MKANTVQKLGFVGRHQLRELGDVSGLGVGGILLGCGRSQGLQDCNAVQHGDHFFQGRGGAQAV